MADPRQYLNNPNVRKFLDVIAKAEGVKHGYNTIFGNERFNNLSAHPNVRKQFKQTDGKMNVTSAAGRYQFLKDTWDDQARRYKLKDFSPQSQDIAAIGLLIQNGSLPYILKGDYQTATKRSGGTWASLPSSPYAQPRRSQAEIDKWLGVSGSSRGSSGRLRVDDLIARYGKPEPFKGFDSPPQARLTVAELTKKYGKPEAAGGDFFQSNQPQKLTVQALTAKYGQPQSADPLSIFGI